MTGCILDANYEGQRWWKTLLTYLLVITWELIYFSKRGNIWKMVLWSRRLRLLCTLCIGISKKFLLHFTIMLLLSYYKMVQSFYKNWLLVLKVTNLDNFRQAVESPKSWNLMCYFLPKNTFLQLKHYIIYRVLI